MTSPIFEDDDPVFEDEELVTDVSAQAVLIDVGEQQIDDRARAILSEEAARERAIALKLEDMDPLERRIIVKLNLLKEQDDKPDFSDDWLEEKELLVIVTDWHVKAWWPKLGYVGVYGPPGIGKTLDDIGLTKAFKHGGTWHEHKVPQCAVLFFEGEGVSEFGPRLKAINEHHKFDPVDGAPFRVVPYGIDLSDVKDIARVVRTAQRLIKGTRHPVVVIIEPLIEHMSGDENTEGMDFASRALRIISDELQCLVIIGHHTNAGEERARGSDKIKARAFGWYRMESLGETIGLVQEKNRGHEKKALEFIFEAVPGTQSVVIEHLEEMPALEYERRKQDRRETAKEVRAQKRQGARCSSIRQLIQSALADAAELPQEQVVKRCLNKGYGGPAIRQELGDMVRDGEVEQTLGDNNSKLHKLVIPS